MRHAGARLTGSEESAGRPAQGRGRTGSSTALKLGAGHFPHVDGSGVAGVVRGEDPRSGTDQLPLGVVRGDEDRHALVGEEAAERNRDAVAGGDDRHDDPRGRRELVGLDDGELGDRQGGGDEDRVPAERQIGLHAHRVAKLLKQVDAEVHSESASLQREHRSNE